MIAGACLLGLTATAAVAPTALPGARLRFEHLTISDGLAQNTVTDVLQDRDGFLWFATENGLHRYDGYRFVVHQHDPDDPTTLSDNYVTDLALGSDGRLLVATGAGGLNAFEPTGSVFARLGNAESLSHQRVWSVAEDRLGNVWVATDAGLDRLAPDGTITHFREQGDSGSGLASDVVRELLVDRRGDLWVGSFGGLQRIGEGSDSIRRFESGEPIDAVLADANVTALYEAADGTLWVGASDRIVRIDPSRRSAHALERAPAYDRGAYQLITDFAEDGNGNLWIATLGNGAERLRAGAGRTERFEHVPADSSSLGDSAVNAIYRDATNVLWFGTESAGISKLNPAIEAFSHYRRNLADPEGLPSNVVWSLYEDDDGSVWVATEAGLSRLDASTGRYRHYRMQPVPDAEDDTLNLVYYVYRDSARRLWAGTGEGLFAHDLATDTFVRAFSFADVADAEYAPVIHMIREDRDKRLWLGSFNGLVRYDPDTGASRVWRRERGEIGDNWVMDIADPDDGTLWIGSEGGLARVDRISGELLETIGPDRPGRPGLSHPAVQSLAVDAAGSLWIGTASGLNRLDPDSGRIQRYGAADGLPSDYIYAVLIDRAGSIWTSTNRGLARMHSESGAVEVFDVSDGLQSNEFNTGSAHLGSSGRVYFGGINGFNAFDPASIASDNLPPRVAITAARVLGRQWREASAAELRHGLKLGPHDTVFAFDFAAFDFKSPTSNRFLFRLAGFDGDWRDAGDSHTVSYTNIDPGRYRFEVRALSSDGVWSTRDAQLPIVVHPPIWASWTARVGYAVIAVLLGLLGLKLWSARMRREHLLAEELERRVLAERLQRFSEELAATLDAGRIAECTVGAARDLVGFDVAALFVEKDGRFELVRSWPESARGRLPPGLAAADAEWSAWLESDQLVHVPAGVTPDSPSGNGGTVLIVPWASDPDKPGALAFARPDGPPFGAQDERLVSALVGQAHIGLENARLFAEVQRLAVTDGLTGLNNRRHFTELATREYSRSVRYGTQLSVIMLDADNFKEINDTHGHQAGDQVLRRLAAICAGATREFDIVGRYGGEEFVVMLPETDVSVAVRVAERIRRDVATTSIPAVGSLTVRITVSAGVAERTRATGDLMDLIARADRALYAAKERGRNRTVVSDGPKFADVGT